eukprot:gene7672-8507_t
MSTEHETREICADISSMAHVRMNVAILGDGRVGKTAILEQWRNGKFVEKHIPTVSEIFEEKAHRHSDQLGTSDLDLKIYDTSGSLAFPAMNRLTIMHSDAFIIVYSIDSEKSFNYAKRTVLEVLELKGDRVPCIVVGNKCDKETERHLSFERGVQLAVEAKAPFMETSAKTGLNIDDIFQVLWRRFETLRKLNTTNFPIRKLQRKRKFLKFRKGTKSDSFPACL